MKDQCYEFIKGANNKVNIVGFGSYGEVKLARNTETGQIVAIKMIHAKNAKDQIDVHHKLDHPRIIRLLNYYYQKQKNMIYMVLQYAEGGTLHNRIKFGFGQLQKDKIKRYFRDVCKAVEYLHSLKYMHRDIKPQNILLTKDDHAKLCDFGFAAILEYRSTLCGTYEYMAPEMIQEKPYDYKVDIWALGILLFQLIKGTAPFRGQSGPEVINEMKKPIVFSNQFQKQQIDLIKKILRVNADNRPTVTAILEHPFFKDVQEIQVEKPKHTVKPILSGTGISIGANDTISFKSDHRSDSTIYQGTKQQQYQVKDTKQQFKHYIPQGVKTNLNSMKVNSNYPSTSLSTSFQSHQSSFTGSTIQPQNLSVSNPNNSIDSTSSHRQQMQVPSFLNSQKMPANQNTKVGYSGQTVPIGTPIKTITPGTYPVQQGVIQNPAIWRKN